jgi:hypothetical protein
MRPVARVGLIEPEATAEYRSVAFLMAVLSANGQRSPGYSLLWWVEPGDVVFHYDRNRRAIVAWSRAVGRVVEAPITWLSHRAQTRRRVGQPRSQPGWWLDLAGPFDVEPVTLGELRERGPAIREALDRLRSRENGALYFPFLFYRDRELRPMQPYLNKLPASVVSAVPTLAGAALVAASSEPLVGRTLFGRVVEAGDEGLGAAYRMATASPLAQREPYAVDPASVERGVAGHADTQNALAAAVETAGLAPRSPRGDEPDFDLAWQREGTVFVAEIKSTTPANEERQLRLGLGQVLRYRALLSRRHRDVRAALIPEREPADASWPELCRELNVVLAWPETFADPASW